MFLNCNIFLFGKICHKLSVKNFLLVRHTGVANLKFPACFCHSAQSSEDLIKKYNSDCDLEKTWLKHLLPTFERSLVLKDLNEFDLMMVFRRFMLKGLDVGTLEKYNVRVSRDFRSLLFPFNSLKKEICAVQTMIYNEDLNGHISQSFSRLNDYGLFGWSLVGSEHKGLVVVTSDPLDALAVNQSTNIPALSLPSTVCEPRSHIEFSPEVLSWLNACSKVIFWMNPNFMFNDVCRLVRTRRRLNHYWIESPEPLPLLYLQNDCDMHEILKEASPLLTPGIFFLEELKEMYFKEPGEKE